MQDSHVVMITYRYYIGFAWSKQPSHTLKRVLSIRTHMRTQALTYQWQIKCTSIKNLKTYDSVAKHDLILHYPHSVL